ncbi:TIM-barrel domain-containing protein [Spongiivirga sp. MCCC 1A20706]|uniref:glycoside hydrolase family 31 protein n=1 Tax=Spongiivirga sp. MCCC 1A20706 TaxID=3160963 RepID=UPI0039777D5B
MQRLTYLYLLLFLVLFLSACTNKTYKIQGNSILISNTEGIKLRLIPYGNKMIRVQYAQFDEEFFPNDHYEMVASHDFDGGLTIKETKNTYEVGMVGQENLQLFIDKENLTLDYHYLGQSILREKPGSIDNADDLIRSFVSDPNEHFTGLGHSYYGREASIDLKGKKHARNYGSDSHEQAPLIVPFFMSSKGYGIFLNSTFENYFNFGEDGAYEFGIKTSGFEGQMDYFFILGPSLKEVLQEYVSLTGKPRLPQKSIFGLQLSDKGHDHNSATPSNETWWRGKIQAHKAAGFPLDHIVNDNRWRAGGGKRCESFIEWDRGRYPNPTDYKKWTDEQGLSMTIDFNRCIGQFSEGWKPEFNIPVTDGINFKESAPDLTNAEFRNWFWNIFYKKSLDPTLKYPGDALWIDEFDEMGKAPKDMVLANGRSSAEMRNYWFFLIAKALVKDGWDKQIGVEKRPYVWVRGMTAGAQRYATLWSGDIYPTYEDMKFQIRSMQLAGLSGFPFWGHDAGGFYDWDKNTGPDEQLYQQWAMAMGAFSPIWKPHGMGASRWPLDRSKESQAVARKYSDLRYGLMPYTYSNAYLAHEKGVPMVQPMILDYGDNEQAWNRDLQYLWGENMLITPNISNSNFVDVWLPKGGWYNYWNDEYHEKEEQLSFKIVDNAYPIFIKAGAIIPTIAPSTSIASANNSELMIHVYAGANGSFTLYEDDGISEKYQTNEELRRTLMQYDNTLKKLTIEKANGNFEGASISRDYTIVFHGIKKALEVKVNGQAATSIFDEGAHTLTIGLGNMSIKENITVLIY